MAIDKRLQYDRQMYALGKRVNFQRGGTGGGTGDAGSPGTNDDGSNANSGGGGGSTNREKGIMSRGLGPKGTTGNTNDFSDDGGVDRSAVGQFSTYGKNVMNQNLKGPSAFSNIVGGIKNYVMGGGILGAGIRGLTGLYDKVTGPKAVDYNDGYNMANIAGPRSFDFGPEGQGNDNQGIMSQYNPYIPVEDNAADGEQDNPLIDFLQRYRVDNRLRQDKQGQLDPAILEMISKLYT